MGVPSGGDWGDEATPGTAPSTTAATTTTYNQDDWMGGATTTTKDWGADAVGGDWDTAEPQVSRSLNISITYFSKVSNVPFEFVSSFAVCNNTYMHLLMTWLSQFSILDVYSCGALSLAVAVSTCTNQC